MVIRTSNVVVAASRVTTFIILATEWLKEVGEPDIAIISAASTGPNSLFKT